jgi:hypothetical protein
MRLARSLLERPRLPRRSQTKAGPRGLQRSTTGRTDSVAGRQPASGCCALCSTQTERIFGANFLRRWTGAVRADVPSAATQARLAVPALPKLGKRTFLISFRAHGSAPSLRRYFEQSLVTSAAAFPRLGIGNSTPVTSPPFHRRRRSVGSRGPGSDRSTSCDRNRASVRASHADHGHALYPWWR